MYFNEFNLQYLSSAIKSISSQPVLILSPDWQILLNTHEDTLSYANEIIKYCISANDYSQAATRFGITIAPGHVNQTLICYIIILDREAALLCAYIQSVLQLMVTPQIFDTHIQAANARSMLVNQLSNTKQNNSEIDGFMKEFDYSYKRPRCAVLIEILPSESESFSFKFDASPAGTEDFITATPMYSQEDIYGSISSDRYLIYKDVQNIPGEKLASSMKSYAAQLSLTLQNLQGITVRVTIGSVYKELLDLRESYLEALFLLTNYEYLNTESRGCLLIHDHVFEYFSSLIPQDYWNNRFSQLFQIMNENPLMLETVTEMSRHSHNLSLSADSLGLHRNTMLQRFSKLKSLTGLNPLQSDYDRMVLRTFSLYANKKITLQAGIVIQPNSVLHKGMQKMADLIYKNSNGRMNLHIHTLSISGNNQQLFDILRSGSIDFIVVATGVMNKFTNNRTKILEFPFLFQSGSEAKYILNSIITKDVEPYLDTIGVKCLNIWTMGWRYLTSNEPIRIPRDMVGKKVRVMFTESLDEYYKNMGAIPVKMNYHDVKDALHAGIIDCQENPYSNTLGMKFYEEQSYITHLKYYLSTEALYTSKSTWMQLTPQQQEIITKAAQETTNWIFKEQQESINQQCKNILLNEKGMKLIDITPVERAQWVECSKAMYASFPHQELLRQIDRARKDYYAKFRDHETF